MSKTDVTYVELRMARVLHSGGACLQSRLILIVLFASNLVGCTTLTREAQIQSALSLTKDHFRSTASVKDDSLDTVATITTVDGFQEKQGPLRIVSDDHFLRAFIDKKTGRTRIQLYQSIYYRGSDWNFFETANFETLAEPQSTPVTVISRDVDCTGSEYLGCRYVEDVGFNVNEELLRTIAASYESIRHVAWWNFKFIAKSGTEYNGRMLTAEIAGFLEAIDSYRAAKGISQ